MTGRAHAPRLMRGARGPSGEPRRPPQNHAAPSLPKICPVVDGSTLPTSAGSGAWHGAPQGKNRELAKSRRGHKRPHAFRRAALAFESKMKSYPPSPQSQHTIYLVGLNSFGLNLGKGAETKNNTGHQITIKTRMSLWTRMPSPATKPPFSHRDHRCSGIHSNASFHFWHVGSWSPNSHFLTVTT